MSKYLRKSYPINIDYKVIRELSVYLIYSLIISLFYFPVVQANETLYAQIATCLTEQKCDVFGYSDDHYNKLSEASLEVLRAHIFWRGNLKWTALDIFNKIPQSSKSLIDPLLLELFKQDMLSELQDKSKSMNKKLKLTPSTISNEESHAHMLRMARMLYKKHLLAEAIERYRTIPKNSIYWLISQEEMAWALVDLGFPLEALAISQTFIHPAYLNLINPESIGLRAISLLRTCHVDEVFRLEQEFKSWCAKPVLNFSAVALPEPELQKDSVWNRLQEKIHDLNKEYKTWDVILQLVKKQSTHPSDHIEGRIFLPTRRIEYYKKNIMSEMQKLQNMQEKRRQKIEQFKRQNLDFAKKLMKAVRAEALYQVYMQNNISYTHSSARRDLMEKSKLLHQPEKLTYPFEKEQWADEIGQIYASFTENSSEEGQWRCRWRGIKHAN